MRVAVITRRFFRAGGGAEGYAVALVRQLASQHEVHVFSQTTDEPVAGAHYHRLAFFFERPRWLNQWVFAWSSWWQTRTGFDVVHSHENTWHGQVQTIHVRPLRLNVMQDLHGWRGWLRRLQIVTSPRLLTYLFLEGARFKPKAGRSIVAASPLLRDECAQAYPHAHLHVVTPGVDESQAPRDVAQCRVALHLPLGVPLLLFVANDWARKGLAALLQALSRLPAEVHLAVVGSLKQQPQFQSQIVALGLEGRVHLTGPLDQVSVAYQAADVLVHPTLEDSYAMVVPEAMAHGLPVVVSAFPWCGVSAELVDGEHALLLASPQDASAMAVTLERLLGDGALQQRLKHAASAFAQAHDWQHASLEYERFYEFARTHS